MNEPDNDENQAFATLGPDQVLDAVEGLGLACDGHLMALNSYENRVYQVGLVDAAPVVAKFYRPGRWSDAAIQEEHDFTLALAELEVPAVPPLPGPDSGPTLHHRGPFRFALYPRRGGRAPNLEDPEVLERLGRFLARIHNLGADRPFQHRPTLDVTHFGDHSVSFLSDFDLVPQDLRPPYREAAETALDLVRSTLAAVGPVDHLALHGDCHPGNILWTHSGPHVVDFDDARNGPAVQDLWMLLTGEPRHRREQLDFLLDGYAEFRDFHPRELRLVEVLRTLRLMHYSAWVGRRWQDPAFPRAFPWFAERHYWEEHVAALWHQCQVMEAADEGLK